MRNDKGQFTEGHRASPSTEFKPGQHWRDPKPHWNYEWLYMAYVVKGQSAGDIAKRCNCTENNIHYWLHKHGIPRRDVSAARKLKHWGLSGKDNGMYGVTGDKNPNWKGGITGERQAFYSSIEWKQAAQQVWKRDRATCQRCGDKSGDCHIHHIVSFAVKELRMELSNLVLLCKECHHWVHSKENINVDWIG